MSRVSCDRKKQVATRRVRAHKRAPRNRRRPNYAAMLCVFAGVAAVSALITFAVSTPMLSVTKVSIKGVGMADRAAVEKAVAPLLGRNMLFLPKRPVAERLLALSEVRAVKVGRDFPRKAWVRVWERRPDAVITDGSSWCLAQTDGFIFHRVKGPVNGVPVVCLAVRQSLKPGTTVTSPGARGALLALASARREGLQLGKISVDRQGDLCLNMGSDFYVRLGQPDDIAKKMALLRRALAYRPSIAKEAQYIDVSCPAAPVWKPKVGAQSAS